MLFNVTSIVYINGRLHGYNYEWITESLLNKNNAKRAGPLCVHLGL